MRVDPKDTEHVKEFEKSLATWTDSRFLSRDQVRTTAMFTMYLVNLAEADGWTYDGHSWKQTQGMGCLVVKATIADIPYVVFTSARTYTSGMKVFLRKLEEELLEWVPDKYRR